MSRIRAFSALVTLLVLSFVAGCGSVLGTDPEIVPDRGGAIGEYGYDVTNAASTAFANPRIDAVVADRADVPGSSPLLVSGGLAAKGAPQKGEGLVYRQTDLSGRRKPHVGQSKNDARYQARQQEHARGNPFSRFEYEILGRQTPGTQLDRLEESFIRGLGGPTNLRNPFGGLQNRRHQMRDERYFGAGGGY